MKNWIIIICLAFIVLFACSKKTTGSSNEQLKISLSTACGWCAPGDSLIIDNLNTEYVYFPSSCEQKGEAEKFTTDKTDWAELVSLLNIEKFNKINLNICNTCTDGCDIRVTVKQGTYSHSISYGTSDNAAVAEIKPLLEKLQLIRARYRPNR